MERAANGSGSLERFPADLPTTRKSDRLGTFERWNPGPPGSSAILGDVGSHARRHRRDPDGALLTLVGLAVRLRVAGRLGRAAVLIAWLTFAAFIVVVWVAVLFGVSHLGGWAVVAAPLVLIGLTALALGVVRNARKTRRQQPGTSTPAFPEPEG